MVHLKGLTALRDLWLDGTRVTNAWLNHLVRLPNLRLVRVTGTDVSAAGVWSFDERRRKKEQLDPCEIRRGPLDPKLARKLPD